jgi:hypothetical protein
VDGGIHSSAVVFKALFASFLSSQSFDFTRINYNYFHQQIEFIAIIHQSKHCIISSLGYLFLIKGFTWILD